MYVIAKNKTTRTKKREVVSVLLNVGTPLMVGYFPTSKEAFTRFIICEIKEEDDKQDIEGTVCVCDVTFKGHTDYMDVCCFAEL